MKSRLIRCVSVLFISAFMALPAPAAVRLCSAYMESFGALQKQIMLASEVFEAPELGMFPMMMSMMMPGAAQLNQTEPIAIHVFDIGDGKTAVIVAVTPATTAEDLLKALTAVSGKPLAAGVDGRFEFDGGAAKILGSRVLLARTAAELDACADGDMPGLPAVEGVVRISMVPAAVVPMLEGFKVQFEAMCAAGGPEAEKAQAIMSQFFGIYTRTLAQINAVDIGIAVQQEGLVIRERMEPKAGSTLAGILASIKPVSPAYLSFVNKASLFSVASGSYTVPEQLKKQIVTLYAKLISSSPVFAGVNSDELVSMMKQSIKVMGSEVVFAGSTVPGGRKFFLHGAMGVADAAAYLMETMTMMQTPAYQAMLSQSGMKISEPVKRDYKDTGVYTWTFGFDEAAFREILKTQLPAGAEDESVSAGISSMNSIMQVLGNAYEYSATPNGLAFGMGSPAMVEQSIDLLQGMAPASDEANRIVNLLIPGSQPVSLGRFSVLDFIRMVAEVQAGVMGTPVPAEIASLPVGEGIVFAGRGDGDQMKCAMLIPAVDIKAISEMAKSLKSAAIAGDDESWTEDDSEMEDAAESDEDANDESAENK